MTVGEELPDPRFAAFPKLDARLWRDALFWWRAGHDTTVIAKLLRVEEAAVYNSKDDWIAWRPK